MAGLDRPSRATGDIERVSYLNAPLGERPRHRMWITEPKVKRAGLHRSFGAFSGKREKIPWKFRKFSGLQEDRL
jgi:hypothetical protein